MKGFLDTSVLVPIFYGDHVHHHASLQLFIQFEKSTGCCGAHSLAEVFATLTRMQGRHRRTAFIFALDGDEYAKALEASASRGIVGGAIYDAMLAHCALKADARIIYSWNTKHYAQCGPVVIRRLQVPPA